LATASVIYFRVIDEAAMDDAEGGSETDSVVGDLHEVAMVSDLQVTEEFELGPDDVPPQSDASELGDESVLGSDDEMGAVNEAEEGETSTEPQALDTVHEPIEDMSAQQLTAHTSAVFAVSVNAANPYFFATGGGDDVGCLWRVGVAEPVARLQGHSETISCIGFSADGSYLATGGLDGIVRVWTADAGVPVVALEGPTQGINWVAWHSRGAVLLAGSEDATAWMWKVPEGSVMQIFSAHSASVSYGGFANGGRNIITASEDGTVRVWNPRAGTVDHCLHASSPQEPYAITCLAAHPSQAVYLFGIETGAVKMAHAETGASRQFLYRLYTLVIKKPCPSILAVYFLGIETGAVKMAHAETGASRQPCTPVNPFHEKELAPVFWPCKYGSKSIFGRKQSKRVGCVAHALVRRSTQTPRRVAARSGLPRGARHCHAASL
jgi:ribosome assembly protein SQT1